MSAPHCAHPVNQVFIASSISRLRRESIMRATNRCLIRLSGLATHRTSPFAPRTTEPQRRAMNWVPPHDQGLPRIATDTRRATRIAGLHLERCSARYSRTINAELVGRWVRPRGCDRFRRAWTPARRRGRLVRAALRLFPYPRCRRLARGVLTDDRAGIPVTR